jgi:hypothetical protein
VPDQWERYGVDTTHNPTLAVHGCLLNRGSNVTEPGQRWQGARNPVLARPHDSRRILAAVRKRWLVGGAIWIVVSALAFWLLNAILAAFIAILGLTVVTVLALAADWDQHSTFEQRELARARKRAVKQAARKERTKDARARDRARWEAHQARKAARAAGTER